MMEMEYRSLGRTGPEELRLVFDELVPPGSAVADFFGTSGWSKPLRA